MKFDSFMCNSPVIEIKYCARLIKEQLPKNLHSFLPVKLCLRLKYEVTMYMSLF